MYIVHRLYYTFFIVIRCRLLVSRLLSTTHGIHIEIMNPKMLPNYIFFRVLTLFNIDFLYSKIYFKMISVENILRTTAKRMYIGEFEISEKTDFFIRSNQSLDFGRTFFFRSFQCWNLRTIYGGYEPSRNRVVVPARQATWAGAIDSLESIPGLLKS